MSTISIARLPLLALLKRGALAAGKPNSPKEILRYVKLHITAEGASVYAFDGTMFVCLTEPSLDGDFGPVMLDRNAIGAIADSSGDTIKLTSTKKGLKIKSDAGVVNLATCDPDDFPEPKAVEGSLKLAVDAAALQLVLRRVMCSTDEADSRLGAVCLRELSDTEINVLSTDSRRLTQMPLKCEYSGTESIASDVYIDPKIAGVLIKLLPESGQVVISPGFNGGLDVSADGLACQFPGFNGRYPSAASIRDVCKLGSNAISAVNAGRLAAAIRLAQHTVSVESAAVLLAIEAGNAVFRSTSEGVGESDVSAGIDPIDDVDDIAIRLNPAFILDCLRTIGLDAECDIYFETSDSPINISMDDGYQYTLMPLAME